MSSAELARTLETLYSPGDVVELRTLKDGATFSGYFDDHQKLVKAAAKYDERGHDVYITLNRLPEEIAYRRYNRVDRMKGRDASTSDKDVERRTHLFIDADCERVSGISSTEEEKRKGREKAREIRDYLGGQGWPDPIVCDSGNGYHLLYRVDLPNDQASLELIAGVLETLDFKFSDEAVKVDTTTKNAARITKFYGTVAKKGDNHPQRPHRPSKILKVPDELALVSRDLLQKASDSKPEEPRGFRVYAGGKGYPEFDVSDWIVRHGIRIKREGQWKNGGYRWILEERPWNGHSDNAAYIVRQPSGAIAAGCHHDSCEGLTWRDLREHFEPGAYDRKDWSGEKARGGDTNDNSDNKFQDLADLPDAEEFPLSALPLTVRLFVREAATSLGCPIDYLGLSALAAASAAIGDTRRIVIKKDWTEGAAIFGMIVGGPASKKTPAMNLALRPVRERQMALKAEYERQKEEYQIRLARHKEGLKEDPGAREPDKPKLGRTYADDTTVERLADILNENRRGVLIIKDELSGWLGAMNQYKQGGKGADRQFWLSVHTNQPVSVDRKSLDEPIIVGHPWVSVIGGIQPEVLPDFGKDRGDGLIDRFIPAYPKPQIGRWSDDEISEHVRELPGTEWQRCVVHFERNVLAHVPASEMSEVAEDLKAIFKVRREKTARELAKGFVELYGSHFPKAVSVFEAGIDDALSYLSFPGNYHARLRTTNMLERLFREVKRRTRVVGVFPNEVSASTLATEIALRSTEQWALKRYLTMDALEALEKPNPQLSKH